MTLRDPLLSLLLKDKVETVESSPSRSRSPPLRRAPSGRCLRRLLKDQVETVESSPNLFESSTLPMLVSLLMFVFVFVAVFTAGFRLARWLEPQGTIGSITGRDTVYVGKTIVFLEGRDVFHFSMMCRSLASVDEDDARLIEKRCCDHCWRTARREATTRKALS